MRPQWNRALVWAAHDARHLSRKRSTLVLGAVAMLILGFGLAQFSCYELMFLDDDVGPTNVVAPRVPVECVVDSDCALMPALVTCCGECDPVPPFRAIPRLMLDELRGQCEPPERVCDAPVCSPSPPGCIAHATCGANTCGVVANEFCEIH